MQLKYKFGTDGLMTDAWFDGLNGSECVTSVSEAITRLRVENPAVAFTKAAKAGLFDVVSDAEYESMLRSVECIAMLWRYKGDMPADKSTRKEVNVLTLLANAITLLSQQSIQLESLMADLNALRVDLEMLRDADKVPDFAPDPEDEETLAEIEEAEAWKAAMAVWELEEEKLQDEELDDFGNPLVRNADGSVVIPADGGSDRKPNKPTRK